MKEKGRGMPAQSLLPLCTTTILLVCAVFVSGGGILTRDNGFGLLSQIFVLATASVGAVFVFTVGAFGISLGVSTLTCVILGAHIRMLTGSVALALLACVSLGVFNCVLSALLTSLLHLPPYVTAVLMLSLLYAVSQALLLSDEIEVGLGGTALDGVLPRAIIFILYFIFCAAVFYRTRIGRRQRLLGESPSAAHLTGISRVTYSVIAFAVAGVGVGLCAFMLLSGSDTVGMYSVSDLGFNIVFAIVLGGMSLSGERAGLCAGLLGAVSAVLADYSLTLLLSGTDNAEELLQMIRAAALLAIMIVQGRYRKGCGLK